MPCEVRAVLTGKTDPSFSPRASSAMAKAARAGAVAIGPLGLGGDEQADLSVHGGPDKAIHHYPADHYPFWRTMTGGNPLLDAPGAFGENISTLGMIEREVCIGDRFRLGTALVETSQGRQPCWKLGHRLGDPAAVSLVVTHGFSGWYYRVIEPGQVRAGDEIALIDRRWPEWDVERVFALLIGAEEASDPAALKALADLEVLAPAWRRKALARMA